MCFIETWSSPRAELSFELERALYISITVIALVRACDLGSLTAQVLGVDGST